MVAEPGWTGAFGPRVGIVLLFFLFVISVGLPNTQQWLRFYPPALGMKELPPADHRFAWRPTVFWAVICGVLLAVAANRIGAYSEFLYFNF